jgi:glutathione synthase/RimK-type ligase-like ATP-grasp enzyme
MTRLKKDEFGIFIVGNKLDQDSFLKLHRRRRLIKKKGLDYINLNYDDLLKGNIPDIKSQNLIVFLFFPFSHWNQHIEPKNYKGIYGNYSFYRKFIRFYNTVNSAIKINLKGKKLFYINHPLLASRYRDKLLVKRKLKKVKLPTPRVFNFSKIKTLHNYLNRGYEFFIKPRYGSMGKGITFLTKDKCQSNFTFRKNKILSRKSDYGWSFKNIRDRDVFLRKLLKSDVYIEEAIKSSLISKKKFDFRVYVFLDRVIYIYPRTNDANSITTNISQGAKGMPQAFLRRFPKSLIKKVKKLAIKTVKSLKVNFAGVDIIVGKNLREVYVLEVNLFPGFPKRNMFDLPIYLINILSNTLKKNKRFN